MKNLKKAFCNTILSSVAVLSFAAPVDNYCGYYEDYGESYYAIINQRMLVDDQFEPFLNCPNEPFCSSMEDTTTLNNDAWFNYLSPDFSKEEIKNLLYVKDLDWYLSLKDGFVDSSLSRKLTKKKHRYLLDYLLLAKQAEGSRSERSQGSGWYQGEDVVAVDKALILENALELVKSAPDEFMRNRVGFQIVRAAHYLQLNDRAMSYFDTYIKNGPRDYMYYRALEQEAGAAFNLKNYKHAIDGFIASFENMPDRKQINAVNLKLTFSALFEDSQLTKNDSYTEAFYFFQGFFNPNAAIGSMNKIAAIDVNSPYLQTMVARKIDQLQSSLFAHRFDYNGAVYFENVDVESQKKHLNDLNKFISSVLKRNELKNKDVIYLLSALVNMQANEHIITANSLASIKSNSPYFTDALRLSFINKVYNIKFLDDSAIDALYKEIDTTPVLNTNNALATAFFNHIAMVYYENNDRIGAALVHVDYDFYKDNGDFTWEKLKSAAGYSNELASKHPFVDTQLLETFDRHFIHKNLTSFEKMITARINGTPADFSHDLLGTYYLTQGNLDDALNQYKQIKVPSNHWNEKVRPELFSTSIKEYMDTDFASRSDKMHVKYSKLLGAAFKMEKLENYDDNKVKLIELLKTLEQKAKSDSNNAADYYYMLANAWYNMSAEGWFVNNLYYIGNDYRNDLASSYWEDDALDVKYAQVIYRATQYYETAVLSNGNRETKAKAVFSLARTNRCHDTNYNSRTGNVDLSICGDHAQYFNKLNSEYSDTAYYKEILRECSWFVAN